MFLKKQKTTLASVRQTKVGAYDDLIYIEQIDLQGEACLVIIPKMYAKILIRSIEDCLENKPEEGKPDQDDEVLVYRGFLEKQS